MTHLSFKKKVIIFSSAIIFIIAVGGVTLAKFMPKYIASSIQDTKIDSDIHKNDDTTQGKIEPLSNNETESSDKNAEHVNTALDKEPSNTSASTTSSAVHNNAPTAPTSATQNEMRQTPIAIECNQAMKVAYTNSRDSQISAENARWAAQVNGFANEASSRGMAFSGYVQEMKNQYQPIHDAKLAAIDSSYSQQLASINCSN